MPTLTPYERVKLWREQNKERLYEQQRRYFIKHKDRIREYQKLYARSRRANAKIQSESYSEES